MARCVLLCSLCFLAVRAMPSDQCTKVKPLFESTNITVPIPDNPVSGASLSICVSEWSCCTADMEEQLRQVVRRDFQALLHHNSRSLEGLLVATAHSIEARVAELSRQCAERTSQLLAQVVPGAGAGAVRALYADAAAALGRDDVALDESAALLFARLFPAVYRHALPAAPRRSFSPDYAACLQEAVPELRPFGDIPRQMGRSLNKAVEATRVLLEALRLGAQVLNSTDGLLTGGGQPQEQCVSALLRMSYCARCRGLRRVAKPCAGYCLNVLRGCLTPHAADLDLPWNGYVEATERLVVAVAGVEDVIRSLDARLTEAIMVAVESGPALETKVKRACGQSKWEEREDTASEAAEDASRPSGGRQEVLGVTLTQGHISTGESEGALSSELRHFLSSLSRSRGFYANLAESLCSDDSFAETRDTADCWNGQRVGEYTKTVVASSVTAQKYNPELTWTPHSPDPRIAQLSDKLRHIKQVVVSQLTDTPQALAYTRNNDDEGSGSGHQPMIGWDEDSSWDDEGSGSGDDPYKPTNIGPDGSSTKTDGKTNTGKGADFGVGQRSFAILSCQPHMMLVLTLLLSYRVLHDLRNG